MVCAKSGTCLSEPSCSLLITFVSVESTLEWKGYLYAVALFAVAVTRTVLIQNYFHGCFVTGMRVRTAMTSAVYRKVGRTG